MATRIWSGASGVEDEDGEETRKGPWTVEEDMQLMDYIRLHGEGCWSFVAKGAGM
jgi:myb proto-oncogene protein